MLKIRIDAYQCSSCAHEILQKWHIYSRILTVCIHGIFGRNPRFIKTHVPFLVQEHILLQSPKIMFQSLLEHLYCFRIYFLMVYHGFILSIFRTCRNWPPYWLPLDPVLPSVITQTILKSFYRWIVQEKKAMCLIAYALELNCLSSNPSPIGDQLWISGLLTSLCFSFLTIKFG